VVSVIYSNRRFQCVAMTSSGVTVDAAFLKRSCVTAPPIAWTARTRESSVVRTLYTYCSVGPNYCALVGKYVNNAKCNKYIHSIKVKEEQ